MRIEKDPRWVGQRVCLILLIIWLLARLFFTVPIFRNPQRAEVAHLNTYLELARSLLERGSYEGYSRDNIDLKRTPTYPVFIALVQALFGDNLGFLALSQLLLTICTCRLIYMTTQMITNETIAIAAAWIYALNPNSLFWALTALTETVFAFFLTLSIFFLVKFAQSMGMRWVILSAITLGIAILTRPMAVWLIPIWVGFVVIFSWHKSWKNRIRDAILVLGALWLIILPWQYRNYVVNGQFTLSNVARATVQNWMIARGLAQAKGITRQEAVAEIDASDDSTRYILEIIRKYPKEMALAQLKGIFRTIIGFEYSTWSNLIGVYSPLGQDFTQAALDLDIRQLRKAMTEIVDSKAIPHIFITLWGLGYSLVIWSLVIAGAFFSVKQDRSRLFFILILMVTSYLILIPLGAGDARFRVPAAPGLSILGGVGLIFLWNHISGPFRKRTDVAVNTN